MADIQVAQGDYGYNLHFTIQTATGGAYDLTGKTITLKVWLPNRPGALIVNDTATVSTATTGTCNYTVASTDFLARGTYNCELEFTEAGKIDSTKSYTIEVQESP